MSKLKPHLKSAKNWFPLSYGLHLETLNTIFSETTIFEQRVKFKLLLKLFKFNLRTTKKIGIAKD